MTTSTATPTTGPLDPVGADLMRTLRALKLGGLKDTLPERLALARARKMGHAAFLEPLVHEIGVSGHPLHVGSIGDVPFRWAHGGDHIAAPSAVRF